MDDTNLMTMGEAARELNVGKARVSQLGAAGTLEVVLVGGRKMVRAESVVRYRLSPKGRADADVVRYTLMAADHEVARISYDATRDLPFAADEVLDATRMPFGTATSGGNVRRRELNDWWAHRSVPDTRPGLLLKMPDLGVDQSWEIPVKSLGLSLSDCYWLRPDGRGDLTWRELNYFENDFAGAGEGPWDQWLASVGLDSPDNTSEGELPKRWVIREGVRMLVKGCRSDDQRPYNEAVATALHRRLLCTDDYVPYELVRVGDGPACACADFVPPRHEYIPAALVRASLGATRGMSVYDRLCRFAGILGPGEGAVRTFLGKMIVCDSILANVDRHWRNFGFVRDIDTLEIRLAPIFDSGNCLWFEKGPTEVGARDWSFAARPFGPEPDRQLALVERLDWFDPASLEGFADEAAELLSQSSHATAPGRLDYLVEGVRERVRHVTAALGVLRYRP